MEPGAGVRGGRRICVLVEAAGEARTRRSSEERRSRTYLLSQAVWQGSGYQWQGGWEAAELVWARTQEESTLWGQRCWGSDQVDRGRR